MDLKLEIVLSSSIKRKKPWPRFCWLGQERESVFLLDDKRVSEINIMSGRTKKKTPKLHSLLNDVVTMAASRNGMWLCGLLGSGDLFLWNRDKDLLKTAPSVPEVHQISTQGTSAKLSLQVSCDGMRVLLSTISGFVFLWECTDTRDLEGPRDGFIKGQWMFLQSTDDTQFPSPSDKEASQTTIFVKTETLGDMCLSAFVFASGEQLITTILKIQWQESHSVVGPVRYSVHWTSKIYPMADLTPPCQTVKSRGALVPAFSPDGQLLAVVLNQRKPVATQVLFVNTENFLTLSSGLGGCGCKRSDIPSKYIRSYWVGSISWSPGGLLLACMLKRGSLLMLVRLGELLSLTSSDCNGHLGPAHFLPIHPLVTCRPQMSAGTSEVTLSSSSVSARDILRQRYSVTWHPRLFYLIVSDGYMATVVKVPEKPSPALYLKTQLTDISKDLETISCRLHKSKAHVKAWLDSVSRLNLDNSLEEFKVSLSYGLNVTESIASAVTDETTLPLFLQDQPELSGTIEFLERMQAFFEEESDLEGVPAGLHVGDRGRLEFASMFDTLHAQNTLGVLATGFDYDIGSTGKNKKRSLQTEIGKIQSRLLTAWAFGLSFGDAMEHRVHLLEHTLCCVVRLMALLHLMPSAVDNAKESGSAAFSCVLQLIKTLLSFLLWDSSTANRTQCLRLLVEFTKCAVQLMLTPHPGSYLTDKGQVSSQRLSKIIFVVRTISDMLDKTYNFKQKTAWSFEEKPVSPSRRVWPSDAYHVAQVHDGKSQAEQLTYPRPSTRLLGVWRLLYEKTLTYAEELKRFQGCDGAQEENQKLVFIRSQIQAALQAAGERLEGRHTLLSHTGEDFFLCGSYLQSAHTWQSQICHEINKSSDRSVFQETRLCLALLYCFLSQYQLRDAQQFGDHMAQLILLRSGLQKTHETDSLPCRWMPTNIHTDAAFAVVQTLGRFMASYFTNQPLFILPAHNVAVLPPLHLPHASKVGRLVPLIQEEVAKAVREKHLSEVWTVDYALDLLLIGGLLPEGVWMAYHLGDWKAAVSLSLAYASFMPKPLNSTQLSGRELHLSEALQPQNIFQAELETLLGNKSDPQDRANKHEKESFSEPVEGEDWDLLHNSMQEILKASVMAGVNVISSSLSFLLDSAKNMCSSLPALVHAGVYLPSPPLYCPQPSPNTQDQRGTAGQFFEVQCRHKVSEVLQRLLLLLRSAHCCHPAAQWYISHLRRARHALHKIKKKYTRTSYTQEEKSLPEGLMKLITCGGFFRKKLNSSVQVDNDTSQIIQCFRELCALCWMLHVRDQLSIHCRKYQLAKGRDGDEQGSCQSEANAACVSALRWVSRLLPFSRFLNAEEILQDILLSLISELPPMSLVANLLVQAFPENEESVRVPVRQKYMSLLQRLKECPIVDGDDMESKETMSDRIKTVTKQKKKYLRRLHRHLATPKFYLWEKDEDTENKCGTTTSTQPGTVQSSNTFRNCGPQPISSDGDSAHQKPGPVLSKHCHASVPRGKTSREERIPTKGPAKKIVYKRKAKNIEHPFLPAVGSWEFELEDDEYLDFLDLFLSYILEKGFSDGVENSSKLPLLRSFCSELRERELHSLSFDVLTTLHRRHKEQRMEGKHPPVFRAGSCYKPTGENPTPEPEASSFWSEIPASNPLNSSSSAQRRENPKGLFGLRLQNRAFSQSVEKCSVNSEGNIAQSILPVNSASLTSVHALTDVQQSLNPKLEAQFPKLGRLLEWMVRWADRRVLFGHRATTKKNKEGIADERVMIRVRASAPAILTALSLLELRSNPTLRIDHGTSPSETQDVHSIASPAPQLEGEKRSEKESSIDTGYPGSAHTPVTGLDHEIQKVDISLCSPADESEKCPTIPGKNLPDDQVQLTFDPQQGLEVSPEPSFDDLDVTPEKEDKSSESEASTALSFSSREDATINSHIPEMSFKLADLASPEQTEVASFSSASEEASKSPVLPISPPEAPAQIEVSDSNSLPCPAAAAASEADTPPPLQPQTATVDPTLNQSATSLPSRQRLGEDLVKLVQHINYLSLGEVLRASFSNLQLAQHSSSATQPDLDPPQPDAPSISTSRAVSDQNALPQEVLTFSAAPRLIPNPESCDSQFNGEKLPTQSAKPPSGADQHPSNISPQSCSCGHYQAMQPLSIEADIPDVRQMENRKLIPRSQGLLTTAQISHVAEKKLSPQVSFDEAPQNDSSVPVLSLKLLKFPLSQYATPRMSPVQPPCADQRANSVVVAYQQPKRKHLFPKEHQRKSSLPMTHPYDSNLRTAQPQIRSSGQPGGQAFSSPLPPVFAQTSLPIQGLRLLQLKSPPHSDVSFPKLPVPALLKSAVVTPAPVANTPMIKLLHLKSDSSVVPTHPSLPRMKELMSSNISQWGIQNVPLRLLRINQSIEETFFSPKFTSNKRQKRRDEKASGKRTEVTFRPNDSIIPSHETSDVPVKDNSAAVKETPCDEDTAGASRPGSHDPSLSANQRLLDQIFSTSAELHVFASTTKRPPECHDAFTNTDMTSSPKLVDKAVSVQTSMAADSPRSLNSVSSPPHDDDPVRDGDGEPWEQEEINTQPGHQFISVLDLEDEMPNDDQLPRPSPETQNMASSRPSSATSAYLHVLATSAIRSDVSILADAAKIHALAGIPEESTSESRHESSNGSERMTPSYMTNPPDSKICEAIKNHSTVPQKLSSSPPTAWFSTRLSELDTQLAALQNIADNLETDFSKSAKLVDELEKLSSETPAKVKPAKAVKKSVRLSVPLEAWAPSPVPAPAPELITTKSEKKTQQTNSSQSDETGSSTRLSPPEIKDQFSKMSENSPEWTDADPGQSELLDTGEILNELVKDGYLSQTELDFSTSPAAEPERPELSGWMSQKPCASVTPTLPTEDRSELRAWMRKKQRERTALYQKNKAVLRERERNPFSGSPSGQPIKKTQANTWKARKEKEKLLLLERYIQRTEEARSLVADCDISPETQRSTSRAGTPRGNLKRWPTAASPAGSRPYSASVSEKRSPVYKSGETSLHLRPQCITGDLHRRLGLDRPVTVLPGDRLSKVSRRGMLSNTKSHAKPGAASQSGSHTRHTAPKGRTELNSTYSKGAAVASRVSGKQSVQTGRKLENLLDSPRLLNLDDSDLILAEILAEAEDENFDIEEDDGAGRGDSRMDWQENPSDSTDSSLSKIDWAAIDKMVAAEEAKEET